MDSKENTRHSNRHSLVGSLDAHGRTRRERCAVKHDGAARKKHAVPAILTFLLSQRKPREKHAGIVAFHDRWVEKYRVVLYTVLYRRTTRTLIRVSRDYGTSLTDLLVIHKQKKKLIDNFVQSPHDPFRFTTESKNVHVVKLVSILVRWWSKINFRGRVTVV